MKKISILLFSYCFCTFGLGQIKKEVEILPSQSLVMKDRDLLIDALHRYNDKKVKQSKSLMFSNTATGTNPCYWVNFAIENYYFKQYLGYVNNVSCQNDLEHLNIASQEFNIEIINHLLEKGVDPNLGVAGMLPLNLTVMPRIEGTPADDKEYIILKAKLKSKKHLLEVIKIFLKHKADPHRKDKFGSSALDYARLIEDQDIVNLLEKKN